MEKEYNNKEEAKKRTVDEEINQRLVFLKSKH